MTYYDRPSQYLWFSSAWKYPPYYHCILIYPRTVYVTITFPHNYVKLVVHAQLTTTAFRPNVATFHIRMYHRELMSIDIQHTTVVWGGTGGTACTLILSQI